jgi:DNA-binding transcriptional LysR family regulator
VDLLEQMRTAVCIADAGSLSAAGRILRRSVPAVSRQLQALERDLGAALFSRSTRRLAVTDAGARYLAHCHRVLREVEEARASVAPGRAVAGTLVASAPVTLGLALLSRELPALADRHPALLVDLRLEDRAAQLVGEGVDVAFRAALAPPDSASVVAHRLWSWRRTCVASPAYLRRRGNPASPEAIATHAGLVHVPGDGSLGRWHFAREGRRLAVEPRAVARSTTFQVLLDGARAGMGLALLPAWLVAADLAQGRLRAVLAGWETETVVLSALHRLELRGSPTVRAFVEHFREAFARAGDAGQVAEDRGAARSARARSTTAATMRPPPSSRGQVVSSPRKRPARTSVKAGSTVE